MTEHLFGDSTARKRAATEQLAPVPFKAEDLIRTLTAATLTNHQEQGS